jgi:hypothetical protein
MTSDFAGKIELDIRDSVPDWAPFLAPKAPAGAPNVLFVPAPPTPADVRRWAVRADIVVSDRGRIPAAVMDQYLEARARREV